MTRLVSIIFTATLAMPALAQSADAGHISVGVTGGTLGIGPEVGYRVNKTIGIRANATFLNVHHTFDSDDIDYRGTVKLKSGGAMVDLYPFGGGFRISGGARTNGNNARVVATPTQPTEINGRTYTPAQIGTLTGRGKVKDFAPALTLGYGGKLRKGFTLGFEAGALFQGRVRIPQFRSSTGLIAAGDLEAERRSIQDDVDDYKVYPILQITAGYRF